MREAVSRDRAYSARIDRALAVAAEAHEGQNRKATGIPYIMHPFHVALILDRHGLAEDVVIAGILHDVLEDTPYPAAKIETAFGGEVLRLVKAVTEEKEAAGQKRPWRIRKEEQLAHLSGARADEAALKAADALHNTRSVLGDLEVQGAKAFQRFNASPGESLWYYRSVATLVRERLEKASPLAAELWEAVEALEEKVRGL